MRAYPKFNKEVLQTLSDRINDEIQRLEKQKNLINTQLMVLPEGTLSCKKNGNYTKWYIHNGAEKKYIRKENLELAEDLAKRKYLNAQSEDIEHELDALRMYLRQHQLYINKADKLLSDDSQYQSLIRNQYSTFSKELEDWVNMPYPENKKNPEQLIHKSISGNFVRSKSEVLIDMALFQNHIPYRYENPLTLNKVILLPDFTIRHPRTGETLYWEHFGMMDNSAYSKSVCNKLQIYFANGIIPSIQLITTYETNEHPLTLDRIEEVMQQYFL